MSRKHPPCYLFAAGPVLCPKPQFASSGAVRRKFTASGAAKSPHAVHDSILAPRGIGKNPPSCCEPLKFGIRDRMIHARPALNDFLFPNPTAPRTAASSFALRAMFIVQAVFHYVNAIWDIGTLFFWVGLVPAV
jgi:hypothetical protein